MFDLLNATLVFFFQLLSLLIKQCTVSWYCCLYFFLPCFPTTDLMCNNLCNDSACLVLTILSSFVGGFFKFNLYFFPV